MPIFFPDATRAVVRTLDSKDILGTKTPGVLVNTFHLYTDLERNVLNSHKGITGFMGWKRATISDSGGFQVMSIIKKSGRKKDISNSGIKIKLSNNKSKIFSPEESIRFQFLLNTDLMVVLDDFTPPNSSYKQAKETVERTILWARKSKDEFVRQTKSLPKNKRPYLIGVVQGGEYLDLREYCTKELVKIGFDGLGYGGWPITNGGKFNYEVARIIADNSPKSYLLYGLGVGKPEEIVGCFKLGYSIFDCVLPTRDARHQRLYVYNGQSIKNINLNEKNFYSYYVPTREIYRADKYPVSTSCDCLLCKNYSRSYLYHLFKIEDSSALRLSTIHNLRFYSILMEKLRSLYEATK